LLPSDDGKKSGKGANTKSSKLAKGPKHQEQGKRVTRDK